MRLIRELVNRHHGDCAAEAPAGNDHTVAHHIEQGWSLPGKHCESAATYVGRRQGLRFVAFYGCMSYAMIRPSEVTSLTEDDAICRRRVGRLTGPRHSGVMSVPAMRG